MATMEQRALMSSGAPSNRISSITLGAGAGVGDGVGVGSAIVTVVGSEVDGVDGVDKASSSAEARTRKLLRAAGRTDLLPTLRDHVVLIQSTRIGGGACGRGR
jgi:hypothetical protein